METRLRAWRFTTLLLAALGMAMGAALADTRDDRAPVR
jgi:hypothetical protein